MGFTARAGHLIALPRLPPDTERPRGDRFAAAFSLILVNFGFGWILWGTPLAAPAELVAGQREVDPRLGFALLLGGGVDQHRHLGGTTKIAAGRNTVVVFGAVPLLHSVFRAPWGVSSTLVLVA